MRSSFRPASRWTALVVAIVMAATTMGVGLGGGVAPAAADTVIPGCAPSDPFTADLAQQLAVTYPGKQFTASVFDERTGCQYDLHPEVRNGTASVLKVEIMAGILLRAQAGGRGLTSEEQSLIQPMITQSDNTAATTLWMSLGAASGMTALDAQFGMTQTTPASPLWGLTTTSARDQVTLLRQVLLGDFGPVGPSYRAAAFGYMTSVTPSQRWGITAGVPAGWTVANKNGWAPGANGWNVNSTGVVYSPSGGAYAVAILSNGWPDEASGIGGIETVNRAIAGRLAQSNLSPHFYLSDQATPSVADRDLVYGNPFDLPIVGDWNDDKVTTVGVVRGNAFYLRNTNSTGVADVSFTYGNPGDIPIVGDWNGDGTDTIGVVRGNTFYLRNSNTGGFADDTFTYGNPGDRLLTGDWNGDGTDTIGVVRGNTFYLRDTDTGGFADRVFSFGNPTDLPVAGDWNGDGTDTIGVVRTRL